MTRGGVRAGAGKPSKGIVRRAMVNLDEEHNSLLLALEESQRKSASDVLRWCIRVASASVRSGRKSVKPRKGAGKNA